MDITMISVAMGILIVTTVINTITHFLNWIHKKKIEPSLISVIVPVINAYVVYGLITTASEASVKVFVYVEGVVLALLIVLSVLYAVIKISEA